MFNVLVSVQPEWSTSPSGQRQCADWDELVVDVDKDDWRAGLGNTEISAIEFCLQVNSPVKLGCVIADPINLNN
tara:strand:+ start:648 stop:869 length:222 start_codon:yes stop_codon:yes gene_type:complete